MEKGSHADKAGFRAGDVIVKINGEAIHDASDFSHALRSRKENKASISILRDKKEQTITLTLPERRQSHLNSENLEGPDFDAETLDLGRLQSEWAHVEPQIEEAINKRLLEAKPEIERAQREFETHQRDFQKAMREMRQQLRDHQRELQRGLRYELQFGCAEI